MFLAEYISGSRETHSGITSDLIASSLKRAGRPTVWQGSRSELCDALAGFVTDRDVVITIGAGDITRTGPELKQRLESRSR